MSNQIKENFNIGDAVKVYAGGQHSQFYIIGRVIYIDTHHKRPKGLQKEYGVLYYGRYDQKLLIIHALVNRVEKAPSINPNGCPSHNFTMNYADEIAEKEKIMNLVKNQPHKDTNYKHLIN